VPDGENKITYVRGLWEKLNEIIIYKELRTVNRELRTI